MEVVARRRDLDWLRAEMDELFADLALTRRRGPRPAFRPAADVYRTDEPSCVNVTVDLAGVDPNDIDLALSDGVLMISGVRRRPFGGRVLYQQLELDHGPFERAVVVGEDVDADGAEATYDRGLLTVRLPVRERPKQPARVVITVVRQA
jgi:HSP20 family protein